MQGQKCVEPADGCEHVDGKTSQSVFCYKGFNSAASATLRGSTFTSLRERQNFILSPFLQNQLGIITFAIDMGILFLNKNPVEWILGTNLRGS